MKIKNNIFLTLFAISVLYSCESEQEKKVRTEVEHQEKIENELKIAEQEKLATIRLEENRIRQEKRAETDRLQREVQMAKERKAQELHDKLINNTLPTGATPYSKYYGGNSSCSNYGCSQIKVRTSNSDVLVTIKKNDRVVRHAFIQSGDQHTFSFPNGTYQAFFYYGRGWDPEKEMKNGEILGGFISEESFGKDDPQSLSNNVLEYELILQPNGNFSTRPSNPEEAL